MVEPTDVTTYEFLSKDGNMSDEFVPGTTAFRVRECGTRRTAGFLRLVPPSVQIAGERADTRRVPDKGLGTAIHELFKPFGGVELEMPPRVPMRDPPRFD